ncbi:MAG TPA: hypothetical protein VKB13_09545 [Gaiellaceae bacterium]|nr:hypothetical protein [Gaiellaceae bacterium]
MSQEMRSWELWGISEADWNDGWRRTLQFAIEAAFADGKAAIGEGKPVQIEVRKRSDNAVHDYRVVG